MAGFKDFMKNNQGLLSSLVGLVPALFSKSYRNKLTGAHLTGAEKEANAFSAQQAQNEMAFQQQMRDTQYQSAVQDMQKAGLNPALMYGSGASGNVAPSGAMASSVSPTSGQDPMGLVSLIASLSLLNAQKKDLLAGVKEKEAGALEKEASAKAALWNAWTNSRNARSQERNAAVAEARVEIERKLADKHVEVDDATINKLAADASYVNELKDYVSKNYDILVRNASSLEKQALAAMRQADAAIQNAATNSYLADYSTELTYSNVLLNEILRGEHSEILKNLPEKIRYEVDNLRKQGIVLDKQGRLLQKQGNLATAMQVKAYVTTATDVAKTVASFIPGASAAPSANVDIADFGALGAY